MIRIAIIDDEPDAITVLSSFLNMHFEFSDIRCFNNPTLAIQALKNEPADLIFLDIEMPHQNGFDVLQSIRHEKLQIIFVTAHDQYAIQAIKANVMDYILKPIREEEFIRAVNTAVQRLSQNEKTNVPHSGPAQPSKVRINTGKGIRFLSISHICHIKADGNYSNLFLEDNKKLVANGQLHELEDDLQHHFDFLRVHRSYIVNLEKVLELSREGYLFLSNGSKIPVSKKYKVRLRQRLGLL